MKASKLVSIVSDYIHLDHTPTEQEVRFGCDCGCGGDYYEEHPEEWAKDHEDVYNARKNMQKLLEDLQIEIDIDTSISERERSTHE